MIGHITQFHAMSKKVRAKNVSVAETKATDQGWKI